MSEMLSIGRFRVAQRVLSSSETLCGSYDVAICTISWESRDPDAFQAIGGCGVATILLRFSSTNPITIQRKNANLSKLISLCPNHQVLELGRSIEFEPNSERIQEILRDFYIAKGRPLRVLIDITCMPKSYASFLCGLGFSNDYICKLDCLYAEGRYDLTGPLVGGPRSIISEGEWASLQVPYLESTEAFAAERDLLVVLGGEIGHSLPFIERYEPNRLGVIFIRDGMDPDKLRGSEKAAYNELVSEPSLIRADFDIGDMLGVIRYVHQFCKEDVKRPVVGLAIGSKAQSLAMAVAALDLENLEVVCRVPSAYTDGDVTSSGRVFFYSIEDRFEPTSYL